MVNDPRNIELTDEFGGTGLARDISDQVDIGGVKLPQALENTGRRHDETAFQHHLSIEDRGRVAADEHEQVDGAAEPEISHGQQADRIVRYVIQKKKPGRDTKQETESE